MYKKILLPRRGSGETRGYITLKPSYFHFLLTVGLGEVVGLDGLGDGTDLVDLQEQGVASLLVNSHLIKIFGGVNWAKIYLIRAITIIVLELQHSGQSYKQFTLVIYNSRVIIWGIFKSGTTLES